jgi:hypothetical protein
MGIENASSEMEDQTVPEETDCCKEGRQTTETIWSVRMSRARVLGRVLLQLLACFIGES